VGIGTRGRVYIGCLLLGDFTITNIYIVTTFSDVVLNDMIVGIWLAEALEVFVDAASLVVRWMVASHRAHLAGDSFDLLQLDEG